MNQHTRLMAEALASIGHAKRNPTRAEYDRAAPAEQRAIISRWKQLAGQTPTMENVTDLVIARNYLSLVLTGKPWQPEKPIGAPTVRDEHDKDLAEFREEIELGCPALDYSRNSYGE